MALKRNMTCNEMVMFIDNELLPQIKLEIQNWIKPNKRQGGYFVTVRQILCFVDFLGAAYSGYPLSESKKDPQGRRIATSQKAIVFMTTFFEPKQTYQQNAVTQLYDMYRHGLVHLYQPKILKFGSRKKLLWFFYKGKRHLSKIKINTDKGKIVFKNVSHLQITNNDLSKNNYYLAVSIDCLYKDFEKAINKYRNKLKNTQYLQRNWRTTVNAICKPR